MTSKNLGDKVEELSERIDSLKEDISRTEGKLESVLDELKTKHGIASQKDLKKRLLEAQKREEQAESELAQALEDFEKKYGRE